MNKKLRFSCLALLLALLFATDCGAFAPSPKLEYAPYSAQFAEYASDPEAWTDLRPSPVDFSHLSRINAAHSGVSPRGASLPRKFDLRELGFMTPAKNQGADGNCWAYTAMGSLESSYLKKTGKRLDLSEDFLSWFAFAGQGAFTGKSRGGGFDNIAVSMLARWAGPVASSVAGSQGTQGFSGSETDYTDALHLENAYFLGLEFVDDENLYLQPSDDARKQLVYELGAISVGIYTAGLPSDSRYYNAQNSALFYNGEKRYPDHSVLVAGWDDDYPRENFSAENLPQRDGAWLVKNSWGSGFGDGGYFWISYEDRGFADGVAFLAGEADNYGKNYGYDDLGWCMSSGVGAGETAWLSNVFTSGGEEERLEAVSFYATSNNASYEIYIYTGLSDASDPISGTLAATASGTLDLAGYHTVKTPYADLKPGTPFSAVLKVTTPGYAYPAAVEKQINDYSDNAIIERGASFISMDGSLWADAGEQGANVCVRAFTSKTASGATPGGSQGGSDASQGNSGGGCSAGTPLFALFVPLLPLIVKRAMAKGR
ncbi:MAG: lectin like domain-containing protein [Synergistaceae bacterium]|nr:lectin like domain-containing protein [Synergistaceae bacterium]